MWQNLSDFFNDAPLRVELVRSVLMVAGLLLLRTLVLHTHFKRHPQLPLETKRRWLVVSRNMTLLLCVFALLTVWASQIQTFALSMVAIAAAIVLATKELIMCLSGSLLRASTQLYSVGDFIEIGHWRGRVVDINLFNTQLMQIGPDALTCQLSGQTVSFPNSLLLSQPLQRDTIWGDFVIHSFQIPAAYSIDPTVALPLLTDKVQALCAPYVTDAQRYLSLMQTAKLFVTPAAEPRVSMVPVNDKMYAFVVRLVVPFRERQKIQQEIIHSFILHQYRQKQADSDEK